MTRKEYIERILRQLAGGYPRDDFEITDGLVNLYLNDGIAAAAKENYRESIKLDGVAYINNSFSTTFSGLSISSDDTFNLGYKLTLPQIPVGLGSNEGISQLRFRDDKGFVSLTAIPLTTAQGAYYDAMRPIPNKILFKQEGSIVRMSSYLQLYQYTASVTMISGGNQNDLNSTINIPDDYFPLITDYIKSQLGWQEIQVKDLTNDGANNKG